jgi:PIN domain nuclease of toxin-antitoxin system
MAGGEPMILDTCALLWLAEGGGRLTPPTLKAINEATAVHVSAISGFEVSIKATQGKLKLPLPPKEWFKSIVEHHGLNVIPLDLDVCILSAELPLIHNDPCDRFIIMTAKLNNLTVVTSDERFEKYGVKVCL